MKSKSFISILPIIFFLAACSGNGSSATSSDFNQDSKDSATTYSCSKSLEDVIVYLNQEKIAYICKSERWVSYNDAEVLSKFKEMPTCNTDDKIAVAIERTNRFTIVCHDRDWFFKDE